MKRSPDNRTDLRKEIPLSKPLSLIIETTNICNFKCRYCRTAIEEYGQYKHAAPQSMTFDEFKKIIDSAKEGFDHVKTLQVFLGGEPLISKEICEMIEYAKDVDISDSLRIFTNGSLLTPALSQKLAAALSKSGESLIQFSIQHVSDQGYKDIAGVDISYDKLLTNIAYFYAKANHDNTHIICKIIDDNSLSLNDLEKYKRDFANLGDEIIVEKAYERHENRQYAYGQDVESFDGYKSNVKKVCTPPFYTLVVRPDFDINACAGDIFRFHVMGNLKENSLKEIWDGEAFFEFRKKLLKGESEKICSYCACYYFQIDDIDDVADELLERLTQRRMEVPGEENVNN